MNVLGISGRERHAAAALAIDGSVVAAATEDSFVRLSDIGYRSTGGYPLSSIAACLAKASLTLAEIDQIAVVSGSQTDPSKTDGRTDDEGHWSHGNEGEALRKALHTTTRVGVAPAVADARQLAASHLGESIVLVLSLERMTAEAFHQRGSEFIQVPAPTGADQLLCATRHMADTLSWSLGSPYSAVEHIGSAADPDPAPFAQVMTWDSKGGVSVDGNRFAQLIEPLRAASGRQERQRQVLAAGFCARIQQIVVDMCGALLARAGVTTIGLAGDFFASPMLARALYGAFGDRAIFAAVPEATGQALGAACSGESSRCLDSLALGPEFSESEIKMALENCRLDYLYEPDWARLLGRLSRLLSGGSVVAWFQGAAGFGPRPVGTRAILADPSNRYARDNINRFLRHGAADDPLPLSMTAAAAGECLDAHGGSPFHLVSAVVNAPWRDKVRASLDHRSTVPVQIVTKRQSPLMFELLELHRNDTGVPGLICTGLAGPGEPVACTPRDAIRTTFSSAVDVFVIGRFLLMKDYWLLRSGNEG